MKERCSRDDCLVPKGLCQELTSPDYQKCPNWNKSSEEEPITRKTMARKITKIPWSGLALEPNQIELISSRSTPKIIGILGPANAGKTSYLGMLYTLIFNGKRFKKWHFAGSYTLIAWETLAKYLKVKPNGKVDFPVPTPTNLDFYSLFHLALRNESHLYDILFADSSGEVFTQWANNIYDTNAENARWIYQHSHAFMFFVDCEAIIKERGKAKQKIAQLAGQIASNLNGRPIVIVWSKADQIGEILPNIKDAIVKVLSRYFPKAFTIQISNFSQEDPDTLCHINNLKATEELFDKLCEPQALDLIPDRGETQDFFFRYRGNYENK